MWTKHFVVVCLPAVQRRSFPRPGPVREQKERESVQVETQCKHELPIRHSADIVTAHFQTKTRIAAGTAWDQQIRVLRGSCHRPFGMEGRRGDTSVFCWFSFCFLVSPLGWPPQQSPLTTLCCRYILYLELKFLGVIFLALLVYFVIDSVMEYKYSNHILRPYSEDCYNFDITELMRGILEHRKDRPLSVNYFLNTNKNSTNSFINYSSVSWQCLPCSLSIQQLTDWLKPSSSTLCFYVPFWDL